MKAETRFPRTVEAYKAHLHEDRPHYDSFQTFCRKQGVRYKGVMQWMHRHNRSVGSLRLEVLLEKNGNDSNLKSSLIEVSGQSFPIKNSCISSRNILWTNISKVRSSLSLTVYPLVSARPPLRP